MHSFMHSYGTYDPAQSRWVETFQLVDKDGRPRDPDSLHTTDVSVFSKAGEIQADVKVSIPSTGNISVEVFTDMSLVYYLELRVLVDDEEIRTCRQFKPVPKDLVIDKPVAQAPRENPESLPLQPPNKKRRTYRRLIRKLPSQKE